MSNQGALFKCLRTFQKGYQLNCSGKDHFCCQYFQRDAKTHRRAKKLLDNKSSFDFDFKRLHNENKNFDDFMEENEVEPHDVQPKLTKKIQALEKFKKFVKPMLETTPETTKELPTNEYNFKFASKFNGGQRRGIVLDDEEEPAETRQDKYGGAASFHDQLLSGGGVSDGYNREMCAELRVPCRFVNDHPCCGFEMPLDLVARARSLDGSADLKWRPKSLGGPRSSQGRSLFGTFGNPTLPPVLVNKDITYNYATNKKQVKIPTYFYNGGPEMTSTIVGLCWRLHYLRCPTNMNFSEKDWVDSRNLKKIHPCCKLVNKPQIEKNSPYTSRIGKWLTLAP